MGTHTDMGLQDQLAGHLKKPTLILHAGGDYHTVV